MVHAGDGTRMTAAGDSMTRQMDLEIEQRDDVCILRISGRLGSGAEADHLRVKVQEIKAQGCRKIIADICELDSIGSGGIGVFVELHISMQGNGGRFVLASPSRRVLEVLGLTGLKAIIPMACDLAGGLAYVNQDTQKASHAGAC